MSENTDAILQRETDQRIRKLTERLNISQADLSLAIGQASTTLSHWLQVKRIPSGSACLCLAGLSEDKADREFWIQTSGIQGLGDEQLRLIRRALQIETPDIGELQDVADLLSNPQNGRESAVVHLVRVTLENRAEMRGNSR